MSKRKRSMRFRSKSMKVIYTIIGAFALGYFPPYYLLRSGGPQVAMVLLALLVIPYGSLSASVLRGLGKGLAIGVLGGLSTAFAIIHRGAAVDRTVWTSILGTAFLCTVVCGLFAYVAQKRRQRIDERWS